MKKLQSANGSITRSYTVGNDSGQLHPGQYRAFFNGDFNNFGTLPATYKIGTSGLTTDVKKDIRKEQLTTAVDGWNYAVDEDRKFWKDDFSSDTSGNYTISGTATFAVNSVTFGNSSQIFKNLSFYNGVYEAAVAFTGSLTSGSLIYVPLINDGSLSLYVDYGATYFSVGIYDYVNHVQILSSVVTSTAHDSSKHVVGIEYLSDGFYLLFDNIRIGTKQSLSLLGSRTISGIGVKSYTSPVSCACYGLKFVPSISYSDSYISDTSSRYQAISGTNTFSTDRLNLTAPAGSWNKTRLKSYKFESGKTTQKIVLPTTGTSGDIVAHYFSGSADMSTNYGVGVKRLASNLWLPVEIKDNTVITTGTSPIAPIQDGDTAVLEVETDMVKGVSWLSCWNNGSKNLMTFDGVDDYVNCGSGSNLNITTGSFSICFSIQTTQSITSGQKIIFDKENSVWKYVIVNLVPTTGQLRFKLHDGTNTSSVYTNIAVNDGIRHNIVFVRDRSTLTLYSYIDSSTPLNITDSTTTFSTDGILKIGDGYGSTGTGQYLQGMLTNIQIYNRALSKSEANNYINKIYPIQEYLVVSYTNTGNTNNDWVDRSGNNNNGTVNGTPTTTVITGSKINGTTLKQFAQYQMGYSGTGYYNVGTSDNTCSLKLLESRARSLLGYTNVPVTESASFVDNFNENSIGKYTVTGTHSIANGILTCTSAGDISLKNTLGNGTYLYTKTMENGSTDYFYFGGHRLKSVQGSTSCVITLQTAAGVNVGSTTWTKTVNAGSSFTIKIVQDTNSIIVYDGTTAKITETPATSAGIPYWSLSTNSTLDAININATRNTYKPMLRGVGVGSYWNETQEVSCARFTDNFENNSLSEYGNNTNFTYDSVNKYIIHNNVVTTNGLQVTPQFNDGWYEVKVTTASADTTRIAFCNSTTSLQVGGGTKYLVVLSTNDNKLSVSRDVSGVTSVLYSLSNAGIAPNTTYTVNIYKLNRIIKIYINNNLLINITDDSPITTVGNFVIGGMTSIGVKIHHINVISINGLFLGGVSHGGFFSNDGNPNNSGNWAGFKFKNHDRDTVYTSTLNRGACTVADSSSFQVVRKNITDSSQISSKAITEDVSVTTSAATISTNDITLNADDVGDDIGIYIQTKNDNAPILPLVSQSLIKNSLTDTTSNNYYFMDFEITDEDIGNQIQIGLFENDQISNNYYKLDYMLMVPTGIIDKTAKRALWNAAPLTKVIKSTPR